MFLIIKLPSGRPPWDTLKLLQYCIKMRFFLTENLLFIFNRLIAIKIPKICFKYKADNYELRLTSHESAQDVGHPIDTQVHDGSALAQTSQTVTKSIFRFFYIKITFPLTFKIFSKCQTWAYLQVNPKVFLIQLFYLNENDSYSSAKNYSFGAEDVKPVFRCLIVYGYQISSKCYQTTQTVL